MGPDDRLHDMRAELLSGATDEQLRAECERRGNGLVMPGGWDWRKAVTGCPEALLEEELARRGGFQLPDDLLRQRATWKARSEDAEERLKRVEDGRLILGNVDFDSMARELRKRGAVVKDAAEQEADAAKLAERLESFNQPRIGDVIEALAGALPDKDKACDVLDSMFIERCYGHVWPEIREQRKLKADIRGLVVAAFEAGQKAGDGNRYAIKALEVPNRALTPQEKADMLRDGWRSVDAYLRGQSSTPHPDEGGPGIARLPEKRSEPLAHLDVDLLADDA